MAKMYSVYKILNNINNKVYIGITKMGIKYRFRQHVRNAYYNYSDVAIGRAIVKYGEDSFSVSTIVADVPDFLIKPFEMYWISFYNSFGGHGYNMTAGGDGLHMTKHSEETKNKMRKFGIKNKNSKPANIYEYKTDKIIAENVSIREWCRNNPDLDIKQSSLSLTARGKAKYTKGYYAKYIMNFERTYNENI